MGQFRIKNIDTGIIDNWVLRVNDSGATVGDDVVAQDPNELAQAISDTQDLLLKASVYAPNLLINTTSGALERIKIIEDTVGSTTLQDAYDNGRFISVQPGRPYSLGAVGEFELDSSGNFSINPNTFKFTNGVNDMFLSETGIVSSNSDLTFGTTSTKSSTLQGGVDIFLKDGYLSSPITLSESGGVSLLTTSQSLVGAINEISSGFTGTNLQQIYDQSAPATVTTSFSGGPLKIVNGSGNPNTPALQIEGGIECIDFLDADKLTIGPGVAINITIDSDGSINTVADIKTTTKVISPRVENPTADLLFLDSRGSANLTEIGDGTLSTTKQSLFGSLNEINTLALQNATSLSALDVEHNLASGLHEIINTQSAPGSESTSRFNIKDGSGVTKIAMNALGKITAEEIGLGAYNVTSELAVNAAHRIDDGTSHSAVAAHHAASNPHNTVKTFGILGDTQLSGGITIEEGAGMSFVRTGNNIAISTSSGNTLQSVYDAQVGGDFTLDTASAKHLLFRDSLSQLIMGLKDTGIEISKNLLIQHSSAKIAASSDLILESNLGLDLKSTTGNVGISATQVGQTVNIENVAFTDGSAATLDPSIPSDIVGGMNKLASGKYVNAINSTGKDVEKGTPIVLQPDGTFWIPYSDISENAARIGMPQEASLYYNPIGVADELILAGASGRIRTSEKITFDLGLISISEWATGDSLYLARAGYSEVTMNTLPLNNDTLTIQGKVYTAKSSGASPTLGEYNIGASKDLTLQNLISTLNNETYMAAGTPAYHRSFLGGEIAKGYFTVTGTPAAAESVTITGLASVGDIAVTLTAVASGAGLQQFNIGVTPEETLVNLSAAINKTSEDSTVAPGTGHGCKAIPHSSYIELRWRAEGDRGNSVTLIGSASLLTSGVFSGGTSVARIYKSDRSANGTLCSSSNPGGVSVSNFTDDESASFYTNQIIWSHPSRRFSEVDRAIKIGRILDVNTAVPGRTATVLISPEQPGLNAREVRERLYDS